MVNIFERPEQEQSAERGEEVKRNRVEEFLLFTLHPSVLLEVVLLLKTEICISVVL